MIIIVEGVDKVGKSTVIRDITYHVGKSIIFKLSAKHKPKTDTSIERQEVKIAYDELFEQALQISMKQKINVIFDRAYFSELVYSIKRGYDAMGGGDHWLDLDTKLALSKIVRLIYLSVPLEIGKQRLRDGKEEYMTEEEYDLLVRRYEQCLSTTMLPLLRLDGTADRNENIRRIKEFLRQ